MGFVMAAAGDQWVPIVTVAVGGVLALVGTLASIIFYDLRSDVKRAVDTLDHLLAKQEEMDERVKWLEGFHPTQRQLAQRYGRGPNGAR